MRRSKKVVENTCLGLLMEVILVKTQLHSLKTRHLQMKKRGKRPRDQEERGAQYEYRKEKSNSKITLQQTEL